MKKSSLTLKLINAPYMIWAVLFILAPLIMVIYYAFTDRSGAFTLDNIKALSSYGAIFGRSAWYAVLATVICLILAYPLAYIMAKSRANTQRTIMMLIMLPMWMNFLIRTYSWITILSNTGLINSLLKAVGLPTAQLINTPGAVILGMVYNFLPYMVLPIYSVMSKLDKSLVEAAQDLGAGKLQVLKKVIFPLSLPGVISGITMVFVPSVSTFYISQKLGGGKFLLIGDSIEMQFQSAYNYNLGAQKIIEDNGYISVGDKPAYEAAAVEGKVVVAGSSSVTPVMEKLAEGYKTVNDKVEIEVQQSDSTTGMTSAIDGLCDIGMASRDLKDSETEAGLTATVIAKDGIAVIVNNDSGVEELTSEQVKDVYTGNITTWEDLTK